MRPTISELVAGITRMVQTTALPLALNSGDNEAYAEMLLVSRMLAFVDDRWDKEFGRLAKENTAMGDLLRDAENALQQLNHPEAAKLTEKLERHHFDLSNLPAISTLQEQNIVMKRRLEKFILIHAGMREGGTPELQAIRRKIRDFLKDINRRDFEAAQLVLDF